MSFTTLFNDTFTGSGNFDGHAPDTKLGGTENWVDENGGTSTSLAGGYVYVTDPLTGGNLGYADTGDAVSTYVSPINELNITFSMVTGSDVTPLAGRHGFFLSFSINGAYFNLSLFSDAANWYLTQVSTSTFDPSYQVVTLAANTTYTGTIHIFNGDQTITFLGQTINSTTAFVDASGLNQVGFSITDGFKVGPLHVEGQEFNTATLDATLPMLTLTGYGGANAALFIPHLTISSAGTGPVKHGDAAMLLPMLTLNAGGSASMRLTAPALTVIGYGGANMHATLQALTLSATAHNSAGENSADVTLPHLTLNAHGGANATMTLPMLTLAIAGTVQGLGRADITLPALSLSAAGRVAGTAAFAGTLPSLKMVGYSGAVCSVTLASGLTIQATGTMGSVGRAAVTLPMLELNAAAAVQIHGGADLLLPSLQMGVTAQAWLMLPGLQLTAIGTAVVTATYEAYALNLNHNDPNANDEMTRYTNFPFTHIVRYQGSYFGVNGTGLYLLEGTTDFAEPTPTKIPWAFKAAMTDFKSPFIKTVVSAYFAGRLGPTASVQLYVGENGAKTFSYTCPRGDHAQNYRQKFGRGIDSRYYALGASGTGSLALDSIEFNAINTTRRI